MQEVSFLNLLKTVTAKIHIYGGSYFCLTSINVIIYVYDDSSNCHRTDRHKV